MLLELLLARTPTTAFGARTLFEAYDKNWWTDACNGQKDPAHANNITPESRREAMTGLECRSQGLLKSPISRSPNAESDFVDGDGKHWDVKTPPEQYFESFDAVKKVKEKLDKGINVVIDTTYISQKQLDSMREKLKNGLGPYELDRIIEINVEL